MAFFMRIFHWVWKKITGWVFFWKRRVKPPEPKHLDPSKPAVTEIEKCKVVETLTVAELPTESLVPKATEIPKAPSDGVEASVGGHSRRSLLQLPRMAMQSVSTFMVSTLQKCIWKSSVSSSSVSSQLRPASPLGSKEAEMLREVYLVLWAIRKQLRQLAQRQEQRRQRHLWALANAPPAEPAPVQAPKQDARSPL
ncbi:sperm acrosome developmental regulator isoform X2 [Sorex araneus]|uniref:sperm acrosome developmental regulator isoform X2 n=1 Tax=Sorex araneus TaxID=42254 RepID=UPI0003317B43|nr:sperm acrosome developmental regulator isoform X2 [Sorex araneus]